MTTSLWFHYNSNTLIDIIFYQVPVTYPQIWRSLFTVFAMEASSFGLLYFIVFVSKQSCFQYILPDSYISELVIWILLRGLEGIHGGDLYLTSWFWVFYYACTFVIFSSSKFSISITLPIPPHAYKHENWSTMGTVGDFFRFKGAKYHKSRSISTKYHCCIGYSIG